MTSDVSLETSGISRLKSQRTSLQQDAALRGAVFTRPEVVEFILDLVGYTSDKDLGALRILEPAAGTGDFLRPIVTRLLQSYRSFRPASDEDMVSALGPCITAVEIHQESHASLTETLVNHLQNLNVSLLAAQALAKKWIRRGDFLLMPMPSKFTHVVGNPPYIRQELVPAELMVVYRDRYKTIYDRADIYVPFMERSLSLLRTKGVLGFICADRWMKNRYGGPLRRFIADSFHLKYIIDMTGADAFHTEVSAYPAITIIAREPAGITRAAYRPNVSKAELTRLAQSLTTLSPTSGSAVEFENILVGDAPWMIESSAQTEVLRRLEKSFPQLEAAGCKVGIGVATGADKVFIAPYDELDVEADRKLPLVTTRDIVTGAVHWRGLGVLNPFEPDGKLANLSKYPKFASYLKQHGEAIRDRHISQKNPSSWYRTIDRIYPELVQQPKLLIPDIKGQAHIVYERGEFYPHHNLYFVTSHDWELRALQAILMSDVTRLFVSSYSTKMRGGYLRFQAQYLRRICLPYWKDIPKALRKELAEAGKSGDRNRCNAAATRAYGLTFEEIRAITSQLKVADAA